jgi:hypothetical protein
MVVFLAATIAIVQRKTRVASRPVPPAVAALPAAAGSSAAEAGR